MQDEYARTFVTRLSILNSKKTDPETHGYIHDFQDHGTNIRYLFHEEEMELKYVDGFVMVVPEQNMAAYIDIARTAAKAGSGFSEPVVPFETPK